MSVSHHDQQRSTASQSIPSESPETFPLTESEREMFARLKSLNSRGTDLVDRVLGSHHGVLNKHASGVDVSPEIDNRTSYDLTKTSQRLFKGPPTGREQNAISTFDDLNIEEQKEIEAALKFVAPGFSEYTPSESFDSEGEPFGDYGDPLFDLARRIHHIVGSDPDLKLLRDIGRRLVVLSPSATMTGAELMIELHRKLGYVQHPKRCLTEVAYALRWEQRIPEDVTELGDPKLTALAGYLIALQRLRGDGKVIIAQQHVAGLFGMSQGTVSALVKTLRAVGFLELLKPSARRQAAEYRWCDPANSA